MVQIYFWSPAKFSPGADSSNQPPVYLSWRSRSFIFCCFPAWVWTVTIIKRAHKNDSDVRFYAHVKNSSCFMMCISLLIITDTKKTFPYHLKTGWGHVLKYKFIIGAFQASVKYRPVELHDFVDNLLRNQPLFFMIELERWAFLITSRISSW